MTDEIETIPEETSLRDSIGAEFDKATDSASDAPDT